MKDFKKKLQKTIKDGAWNNLKSCAEFYAKHCMHPHQTIIITQNGIELLEGQRVAPFELVD